MNNDNKVETAIAGLNCWTSYAAGHTYECKMVLCFNDFTNIDGNSK